MNGLFFVLNFATFYPTFSYQKWKKCSCSKYTQFVCSTILRIYYVRVLWFDKDWTWVKSFKANNVQLLFNNEIRDMRKWDELNVQSGNVFVLRQSYDQMTKPTQTCSTSSLNSFLIRCRHRGSKKFTFCQCHVVKSICTYNGQIPLTDWSMYLTNDKTWEDDSLYSELVQCIVWKCTEVRLNQLLNLMRRWGVLSQLWSKSLVHPFYKTNCLILFHDNPYN